MELLKFMYSNNLTITTVPALLDVLMFADKFDVSICLRHSIRLFRNQKIMTHDFLRDYFNLPSNIIMSEVLRPLTVYAKQFYVVHYKDITIFKDEILSLPLADVEALIVRASTMDIVDALSDDLHVTSEDAVYMFVIEWARAKYPNIQDRREIIMTRLANFIRYPYMTYTELRKLRYSNEIDRLLAERAVCDTYIFEQNSLRPDNIHDYNSYWFVKRIYQDRPAKKTRVQERAVYLDRLARTMWVQDCFYWAWKRRRLILCFAVGFMYFTSVCSKLKPAEEFVSKIKGSYAYTG